jgi:hemerythrin-like domain-containing protein
MEAKGFARDCGPTGVMIYEHEQGRKFVCGMAESIDAAAKGDAAEQKEFIRNAREYIDLLREHIRKEDHCLFGMANNAFTEQDQQALLAAFENVEANEIGQGVHDKYLIIADDLAKRFGVAIAHGVKASGHACGCGH